MYFYLFINVQMVKLCGGVTEGIKSLLLPQFNFFPIEDINVLYHNTTQMFIDCFSHGLFFL